MLKISKLADYATSILSQMARHQHGVYTARDLTVETHISLPTVMKLLKQLSKAGLLNSQRGSTGGYSLAHAPEDIRLIDIITAIEGDIGLTECSLKARYCSLESTCATRNNWQTISQLLYSALEQISLAQMAYPLKMQQMHIVVAGNIFSADISPI